MPRSHDRDSDSGGYASPESIEDEEDASPITEFFNDKSIFITGVTGFVGKVSLETKPDYFHLPFHSLHKLEPVALKWSEQIEATRIGWEIFLLWIIHNSNFLILFEGSV